MIVLRLLVVLFINFKFLDRFNATDAANFSDATTAACDTNAQMPQIYRQMSKVSTTLLSIYVGDCKAAIRRE
ncbi:hypothetical protein CsatB_010450 [Cannabis sativa]